MSNNKLCPACSLLKEKKEFYEGKNICKRCYQIREKEYLEKKKIKVMAELVCKGILKKDNKEVGINLYQSCLSRIIACKYDVGIYLDIECDWDCPISMMTDIIIQKPSMWLDWQSQFQTFKKTNKKADRPSIDRIDEFGNYTLENIQMLSSAENSKKAKSKPSKVLLFKEGKPVYSFSFITKQEMQGELEKFGMLINIKKIRMNTGDLQSIGKGYYVLLQSEKDIEEAKNCQSYLMVSTPIDPSTGEKNFEKRLVLHIDEATFEFFRKDS